MSAFDSLHKRTAAWNNRRLFGETVTYYRQGSTTGIQRTAVVTRDPIAIYQELGQQVGPSVICSFLDDETEGILASEVNVEIDQIKVALDVGLEPEKRQIVQLLSSKGGKTRVLVQ